MRLGRERSQLSILEAKAALQERTDEVGMPPMAKHVRNLGLAYLGPKPKKNVMKDLFRGQLGSGGHDVQDYLQRTVRQYTEIILDEGDVTIQFDTITLHEKRLSASTGTKVYLGSTAFESRPYSKQPLEKLRVITPQVELMTFVSRGSAISSLGGEQTSQVAEMLLSLPDEPERIAA